jgi:8-oxo-dGTP pyrophosphatase MutT (NUDIX family)
VTDPRRDLLVEALARHRPADARERDSVRRLLAYLSWLPHPFNEAADPTHVTASAVVLDGGGNVLLHRHKRLGAWLQPGGHIDPGETPAEAAVRETCEETGLTSRHPGDGPTLVHVDVHEGPRGHVHLDLRYLLLADGDLTPAPADGESPEVAWLAPPEAAERGDASLRGALRAGLTTWRDGPR